MGRVDQEERQYNKQEHVPLDLYKANMPQSRLSNGEEVCQQLFLANVLAT